MSTQEVEVKEEVIRPFRYSDIKAGMDIFLVGSNKKLEVCSGRNGMFVNWRNTHHYLTSDFSNEVTWDNFCSVNSKIPSIGQVRNSKNITLWMLRGDIIHYPDGVLEDKALLLKNESKLIEFTDKKDKLVKELKEVLSLIESLDF